MDDYRRSEFACDAYLSPKYLALHITRAVIIIKIKPDLAPCNYFLALGEFYEMGFGLVVVKLCIVRMNADARVNIIVLFTNRHRTLKIIRVRIARPDRQHRSNASILRPVHDLITVSIKLLAVNMTVGIYKLHFESNLSVPKTFSNLCRLSFSTYVITNVKECPLWIVTRYFVCSFCPLKFPSNSNIAKSLPACLL